MTPMMNLQQPRMLKMKQLKRSNFCVYFLWSHSSWDFGMLFCHDSKHIRSCLWPPIVFLVEWICIRIEDGRSVKSIWKSQNQQFLGKLPYSALKVNLAEYHRILKTGKTTLTNCYRIIEHCSVLKDFIQHSKSSDL